ncbi:hypothetical protein [Armatimonas sp.]|uniref:hypothetical protein n=1 Tax=Armatimonas sp. TaxID=1872638 RepID=UPI003750931F
MQLQKDNESAALKPSKTNMALAVAVVASVLSTILWILKIFINAFSASPDPVKASIIAGVLTISGTVASMIYNAKSQRKREIEASIRTRKSEAYEHFIGILFNVMKNGIDPEDEEIKQSFYGFFEKLTVWGSDEVVVEYIKWKSSIAENPDSTETLHKMEQLLLAIRRDLGHENKYFRSMDLMRIFVNDLPPRD